jgi:hypothetical protein
LDLLLQTLVLNGHLATVPASVLLDPLHAELVLQVVDFVFHPLNLLVAQVFLNLLNLSKDLSQLLLILFFLLQKLSLELVLQLHDLFAVVRR